MYTRPAGALAISKSPKIVTFTRWDLQKVKGRDTGGHQNNYGNYGRRFSNQTYLRFNQQPLEHHPEVLIEEVPSGNLT